MNKYMKLVLVSSFLFSITSSSYAGVFFCAYQIGDAPGEPYNRDLCLKIEKQCVPTTFTKMFKERDLTIVAKVYEKTGALETGVMPGKSSKELDAAFHASHIQVSPEFIAANPIAGVDEKLQPSAQLNAAMCESAKLFASSYLSTIQAK